MKAEDVTETLNFALQVSRPDQVHIVHRPRLLSDNDPSHGSVDLAKHGAADANSRGSHIDHEDKFDARSARPIH